MGRKFEEHLSKLGWVLKAVGKWAVELRTGGIKGSGWVLRLNFGAWGLKSKA